MHGTFPRSSCVNSVRSRYQTKIPVHLEIMKLASISQTQTRAYCKARLPRSSVALRPKRSEGKVAGGRAASERGRGASLGGLLNVRRHQRKQFGLEQQGQCTSHLGLRLFKMPVCLWVPCCQGSWTEGKGIPAPASASVTASISATYGPHAVAATGQCEVGQAMSIGTPELCYAVSHSNNLGLRFSILYNPDATRNALTFRIRMKYGQTGLAMF